MKRNHLPSIQSQNVLVRNGKMGIIAMRVRMEVGDRTYKRERSPMQIKENMSNERVREKETERDK